MNLTEELTNEAIEYVFGKDSGIFYNGCRCEGVSLLIEPGNYIGVTDLERLRLRLNSISRKLPEFEPLAWWRIRTQKTGYVELRYLILRYYRNEPLEIKEIRLFDDEDGEPIDGYLSFASFLIGVTIGKIEVSSLPVYDLARAYRDDKKSHYFFNGQRIYNYIRAYIDYDNVKYLKKAVKLYVDYCNKENLKLDKIKTREYE